MTHDVEILTRSYRLERADVSDNNHMVEGIAVPFGQTISTWDGKEVFDPDTIFDGLDAAKLYRDHNTPIGRIIDAEQKKDGLHIIAQISDTEMGRDTYQLLKDGVLDSMSVGFIPVESQTDNDGVTHRRTVQLLEVSIVPFPAYTNAKVENVRSQSDNIGNVNQTKDRKMTDTTTVQTMPDTSALFERLDALEKQNRDFGAAMSRLEHPADTGRFGAAYRSAGEYLRALANGDASAAQLMKQGRDLLTSSEVGHNAGWVDNNINLVQSTRTIKNLFATASLPASGMSVEYNALDSNGVTAAAQANEGDGLTYGEVKLKAMTAPVKTYGGYTHLSKQVIDRSTTPMLDTSLRALTIAYAQATENAFRASLKSELEVVSSDNASADLTAKYGTDRFIEVSDGGKPTLEQWVSLMATVAAVADGKFKIDYLMVNANMWTNILTLAADAPRAFDFGAGVNTLGTANVFSHTASFLGLPVVLFPDLENDGDVFFVGRDLMTAWESGGVTQLTNSDVVSLGDSYSVYGYMATGVTNPLARIKVNTNKTA